MFDDSETKRKGSEPNVTSIRTNCDPASMSESIELVIFDCDGVLVDSERIAVRVMATVFERLGQPLADAEIIERYVGLSGTYAADIRVHARNGSQRSWEEESELLYRDALVRELTPVDGVVEALDAITISMCVASNGSHEKMRLTLGLTGLYERFAGRIFSASDVARSKPEPDLFLHAAAQMGVAPAACAVVEDSEPGVRAARAAGMRVFGYAGGVTPASLLEDATVVFDDMRLLPTLLEGRE
jgi:HAD superfamily hydrolase (TIGR01509 family)